MAVPEVEFEMKDVKGSDIAVPNCTLCLQHVYFVERVVAQKVSFFPSNYFFISLCWFH